jgi:hypothetical protein
VVRGMKIERYPDVAHWPRVAEHGSIRPCSCVWRLAFNRLEPGSVDRIERCVYSLIHSSLT